MAPSPLPSQIHSSSKRKQQMELELRTKRATRTVCTGTKEGEENALQNVQNFDDRNRLALQRAHEIQDNLGQEFPCFVKPMLRSCVTGGFWLGLPRLFCLMNLPKHDETIVLVGQNDEEYNTKYLAGRNGLSGGWRGFAVTHNLLEGDVLVFQLIKEWKFKVLIVRASGLTENDGASSQLNLNVEPKPIVVEEEDDDEEEEEEEVEEEDEEEEEEEEEVEEEEEEEEDEEEEEEEDENADCLSSITDEGDENSEILFSDILEKIGHLHPVADFKDTKNFKDFNVIIDGLPVGAKMHELTRRLYYELCRDQQCYLHERLISGLSLKSLVGIINETAYIADSIESANLTTPLGDLESWDKTLKSFQDLGMAVGFLRERLKGLKSTALEEEMKRLRLKALDVKRELRKVDDEMEVLKDEDKKLAIMLKEPASAP